MGIEKYIRFKEKYGKGVKHSDINIQEIDEYDLFWMPDEIIDFLSEEGISSYIGGYLWTLNPKDYVEIINNLIPFDEHCIPFARSAFGDILFLREKNIYVLNLSSGKMSLMTDDFESFVNRYLTDDWFYETFFNKDLFDEIKEVDISSNECLGFDPLLSEGGTRIVNELTKINLRKYLESILNSSAKIDFYEH